MHGSDGTGPEESVGVRGRSAPGAASLLAALAVIVAVIGAGGYWLIRSASQRSAAYAAPQRGESKPASRDLPLAGGPAVRVEAAPPVDVAGTPQAPRAMQFQRPDLAVTTPAPPATAMAPPASRTSPSSTAPAVPVPTNDLVPMTSAAALSGEAGLVEALRTGQLRLATEADLQQWIARSRSPASPRDMTIGRNAYVITRDFTMPDGLYGAHSVVFLLPAGVPFPRGDAGHSVVLDLSSGACAGITCSSVRR